MDWMQLIHILKTTTTTHLGYWSVFSTLYTYISSLVLSSFIEDNAWFKCGGGGLLVLIAYFFTPINFLLCLKNKSKKEAKIQKSQKWKILGLEWKPTWALQGNKKVTRRILDPGKNGFLSETRWGLFLFLFLFFFLLVRSSFESARWKPERAPWQELESKRIECILGCSLFFFTIYLMIVWCGVEKLYGRVCWFH